MKTLILISLLFAYSSAFAQTFVGKNLDDLENTDSTFVIGLEITKEGFLSTVIKYNRPFKTLSPYKYVMALDSHKQQLYYFLPDNTLHKTVIVIYAPVEDFEFYAKYFSDLGVQTQDMVADCESHCKIEICINPETVIALRKMAEEEEENDAGGWGKDPWAKD